jgi:hypothetical protein
LPDSLVVTRAVTPVAVAVAVTGTLGTAAPLASVTVPKITLVAVWAKAAEESASARMQTDRKEDMVNPFMRASISLWG